MQRLPTSRAVVAFVSAPTPGEPLAAFHSIWWVLVGSGACVTALSLFLPSLMAG